jgi:hypothetical protein
MRSPAFLSGAKYIEDRDGITAATGSENGARGDPVPDGDIEQRACRMVQ